MSNSLIVLIVLFGSLFSLSIGLESFGDPVRRTWRLVIGELYQEATMERTTKIEMTKLLFRAETLSIMMERRVKSSNELRECEEVEELIELTNSIGLKCDEHSYWRFDNLMSKHIHHTAHVLPYLRELSHEHSLTCRQKDTNRLKRFEEQLESEDKDRLRILFAELRKCATESTLGIYYGNIPEPELKDAMLAYFESPLGGYLNATKLAMSDHNSTRRDFEEEFVNRIGNTCHSLNSQLRDLVERYANLIYKREGFLATLDDFTKDWLSYGNICIAIVNKMSYFIDETLDTLASKAQNTPQSAAIERAGQTILSLSGLLNYLRPLRWFTNH